jgi:hypothetical protein
MLRKDAPCAMEPDMLKAKSVRHAEDRGTCSLPSLQEYVHSATGQEILKTEPAEPAEEVDGLYSEGNLEMISNHLIYLHKSEVSLWLFSK